MIELNNIKFALNEEEFVDSLFKSGGTCTGYYKANKRHIVLMDKDKNRIGIISNMVLAKATKQENGKYWYSYGMPTIIGEYDYSKMQADLDKIYSQYPMPIKY